MMFAKGHSPALQGILTVKMFMGASPPDSLCCLYNNIKGIGNIIASVEGVVIKTFLIKAPEPLPLAVSITHSLYI